MVEQGAAPRPHQVAEYRPDTDAWTLLPPSTVGFWDPCWFFTDGRLVIVSQDARAGRTGLARPVGGQLDLTTGRWSSVPQVTPAFLAGAGCPLPRLGVGPEWIGGGAPSSSRSSRRRPRTSPTAPTSPNRRWERGSERTS